MKVKFRIAAVAGFALGGALFADGEMAMRCVAHRGMWGNHMPQNTVEAIKLAYDSGATWVETDFYHTKAGQMVCIHGTKELASYTSCKKKIEDLTPEDIATLNLGEKMRLPKTYRIPLLHQVLAVVPKTCVLQSEIKGYSPQYADLFDAAVKAAGLSETNIVLSSFNYDALKDFKARYPKYRPAIWLATLRRPGALDVRDVVAKCKKAGITVYCPGITFLHPENPAHHLADALRAEGIDFRAFGVEG